MKQIPIALIVLLLAQSCSSPDNTPTANKFSQEVDNIFLELTTEGSPGCAVAVFRGNEIIFQKGYGLANIEQNTPITTSTVFDIASVSKQFTAYAAAQLIEQGKISTEDDIKEYFPELVDFPHTITVGHLIHHTSGLRDWPQALAVAGWSMEDELTFEQILRMAWAQKDLNYEPGEEYSYTNTGYVLLAELVSRVAGEPFHEHINKVVYQPLGMANSTFNDNIHNIINERAPSYYKNDSGGFINYANTTTAMGSSSMFSTAEDLAKWLMFLSKNKENDPVVARVHQAGVLNNGDTIEYAYGIWYEESGGLAAISHTGSWAGYRAITMRFPTEDFGLVILSNLGDFDRYAYATKLAKVFLGDAYSLPESPDDTKTAPAKWLDIAGVYTTTPTRIYQFKEENGKLMLTIDGAFTSQVGIDSTGAFFATAGPNNINREGNDLSINRQILKKISNTTLAANNYEGTYYSDELEMIYKVIEKDGQLYANSLRHGPIALDPVAGHLFAGSEWYLGQVLFTGQGDNISGFQVFGGRIRRLNFRKITSW